MFVGSLNSWTSKIIIASSLLVIQGAIGLSVDYIMNPDHYKPMSLLIYSLWIGIAVFIIVAMVSVDFPHYFRRTGIRDGNKVEDVGRKLSKGPGDPPVFAYWISGTGGEGRRILRLLKAVYHPRNVYLLHLDATSTDSERMQLARSVHSERVFQAFDNVNVVGKSYAVNRAGSSVVAVTLHGAAVLLKISTIWDWFITLSASDYPIVTQDDLLHAFTSLPRDLNFIDHTSDLGWKEYDRFDRITVDPSLYIDTNNELFYATEHRTTPDAFNIFTGSPWVILSRPFLEHCVHGWDNLPRTLLMYFANVAYAMESYFQTVICNTPKFRNTTVNNDLRYFVWDDPPKLEPLFLNQSDYQAMTHSGAAFARPFLEDDPVLQMVDKKILQRSPSGVGLNKWCRRNGLELDSCFTWGNINTVKPRRSGKKLRASVFNLILHSNLSEAIQQ